MYFRESETHRLWEREDQENDAFFDYNIFSMQIWLKSGKP